MKDPEKVYEEYMETRCAMRDATKPSAEQVRCAENLLRCLGYEVDDYDFEEMDRWEVDDLIETLKRSWECNKNEKAN